MPHPKGSEYQRQIVQLYARNRGHKEIAAELDRHPVAIRSVIRRLRKRGELPPRYEWPVPR